jgi:hypothetical protein
LSIEDRFFPWHITFFFPGFRGTAIHVMESTGVNFSV